MRYSFKPTIELAEVERPANAKKQYGEIKIDKIADTESEFTKYSFTDSLMSIIWSFEGEPYLGTNFLQYKQVAFHLQNNTTHSIKIKWDDSAFVTPNGVSHRILHSGIKYSNADNPMPPTIIVRKGMVDDMIVPVDNISFESGQFGGWKITPYLETVEFESQTLAEDSAKELVDKSYQVLLSLEIEGIQNDYIFVFNIPRYELTSRLSNYFKPFKGDGRH